MYNEEPRNGPGDTAVGQHNTHSPHTVVCNISCKCSFILCTQNAMAHVAILARHATTADVSQKCSHGGMCPPQTPVFPGHGNCRNPRRKNWGWGGGIGSSWSSTVVNSCMKSELSRQSQSESLCVCVIILFTSGSCSLAKHTKLCTVWQPNIRNMLRAFCGLRPSNPQPGICPQTSCAPYLQILAMPLTFPAEFSRVNSECPYHLAHRHMTNSQARTNAALTATNSYLCGIPRMTVLEIPLHTAACHPGPD